MDTKPCSKCEVVKPLSDFREGDRYRGGYRAICKACENEDGRRRRLRAVLPIEYPETKRCRICKQIKSASNFRKMKGVSDGLRPWCNECNRSYQREWARKKYHDGSDHAERQRKATREYHRRSRKNPEGAERLRKIARKAHATRRGDPERWEEYTKKAQSYYQNRRVTSKYKLYRQLQEVKRRGRKRQVVVEDVTAEEWFVILASYNNCCAYCGLPGKLEQEHVVPLSRGGAHSVSNIVPACRSCNARKSKRTPEEAGMSLIKPDRRLTRSNL